MSKPRAASIGAVEIFERVARDAEIDRLAAERAHQRGEADAVAADDLRRPDRIAGH